MAQVVQFKASLLDSNGLAAVSINTAGNALTVQDKSNYLTNSESGHSSTDFSYFRRILVEHYKGAIVNLSSLGDGDVLISPGISGLNSFVANITAGDGRYQITLRTVPNWKNSATYQASDDCVFVPGLSLALHKWYKAKTNNSGSDPATNPNDWEEILEADLPAKYNTTLFVFNDTALKKCLADKTEKAVCTMKLENCNDDILCSNKTFLQAAKLLVLLYDIQLAVQNQNTSQADTDADLALKICNCTTC